MEALSRHMKDLLKEFCMDSSFAPVAPVPTPTKAPGSPASSADNFSSHSAYRESVPDQTRFRGQDVVVPQSARKTAFVKRELIKQPDSPDSDHPSLCHRHACLRWRQSLQTPPFRSASRVSLDHGRSEDQSVAPRQIPSQQSMGSPASISKTSGLDTSTTTLKIEAVDIEKEYCQTSAPTSAPLESFRAAGCRELHPSRRETTIDDAFLEMRIKSPEPFLEEEEEAHDFRFLRRPPPPLPVLFSPSSSGGGSSPFATPPLSDSDEPLSDIPRVVEDEDEYVDDDVDDSRPPQPLPTGVTLRQTRLWQRRDDVSLMPSPSMRRALGIESLMETAVSPVSSTSSPTADVASASDDTSSPESSVSGNTSSRASSVSDESQLSTSCASLPSGVTRFPVIKTKTECAKPEKEQVYSVRERNLNHGASPEYSPFRRIDERKMRVVNPTQSAANANLSSVPERPRNDAELASLTGRPLRDETITGRPFREVTNILDAAPEKDRHCAVNLTSPHVLSLRHHHHRHPGLMSHRFESAQPILYPTPCQHQPPMHYPLFTPQMVPYTIPPPPTYNPHYHAQRAVFPPPQPPVPLQQQRHNHSNAVVMMANMRKCRFIDVHIARKVTCVSRRPLSV